MSVVELAIGGMTCASCATRIEKKLNRIDGVTATVNYATEKAKVDFAGRRHAPTTWSPTVENDRLHRDAADAGSRREPRRRAAMNRRSLAASGC